MRETQGQRDNDARRMTSTPPDSGSAAAQQRTLHGTKTKAGSGSESQAQGSRSGGKAKQVALALAQGMALARWLALDGSFEQHFGRVWLLLPLPCTRLGSGGQSPGGGKHSKRAPYLDRLARSSVDGTM